MAEARARVRITGDASGLSRASRESQAALQRISAGVRGLRTSALAAGAAVAGIGFAIKRFALDPFGEQQQAIDELQTALAVTGKVGVEAFESIYAEAQRLQSITQAGDEALLKATATLSTLAPSLQADELVKAQRALVGLADTFFRGDLNNAALILGKSLSSGTNALIRYGVELDLAADASGRLAQVLTNPTVSAAFDISQAKVEGYAGSLVQLQNAFGDLQETLGGAFAAALGVEDGFGGMIAKIQEMQTAIEENEAAWVAWIRVILDVGKAVATTVASIARVFWNLVTILGRLVTIIVRSLDAAVALALQAITDRINAWLDQVNQFLPDQLDIEFRFPEGMADDPLRVVREQSALLAQDVRDIADSYLDTGQAWVDAVGAMANAANTAGRLARDARLTLPALAPGGAGGALPGELPTGMVRSMLTRGGLQDRELFGTFQSMFQKEMDALWEGMLPGMFDTPAAAAEESSGIVTDAAGNVITAFGAMAQAAVTGSYNMTQAVVNAFTQIGQALTGPGGPFAGFLGGLGFPIIGAVGGLLSAVVGRPGSTPQPVRIEGLSERAVDDFSRVDQGPSVVNLQLVSATTGEIIGEVETLLRRREASDAIERIPPGVMFLTTGGA